MSKKAVRVSVSAVVILSALTWMMISTISQGAEYFKNVDEEIELKPILDHIIAQPPLDLAYSEETETKLPELAGGLSVALARTFKIIEPDLKNPRTEQWERAFRIFDLLL